MSVVATLASTAAVAAPALAPGDVAVFDHAEALQRMEFLIKVLRAAYVREGWSVDEVGAANALTYMRAYAARPHHDVDDDDHDDAATHAIVAFLGSHGQSLDWVFAGDPSGMISQCAGRSERARDCEANSTDPIFSAIERHRSAWAEYNAAVDDRAAREGRLPDGCIGAAYVQLPKIRQGVNGGLVATVMNAENQLSDLALSEDDLKGSLFENLSQVAFFRAYSNKDIDDFLPHSLIADEARDVARHALARQKRRVRSAKKAAGIPEAERRLRKALDAEEDELDVLASTVPTTVSGARALIEYWRAHHSKHDLFDEGSAQRANDLLLLSLGRAFDSVATRS
jgi:hypothetical protein